MGNSFISKSIMQIALLATALALSACTGQTTGFSSTASGYCAGSSCTALLGNNPSIFISSQGVVMPKLTSYIRSLPVIDVPSVGPKSAPAFNTWIPASITPHFFNQRSEISGTCNTGGAIAHQITYSIKDTSGSIIGADIYTNPYPSATVTTLPTVNPYMSPTYCENGHFNFIVTPPGGYLCKSTGLAASPDTYCGDPVVLYYIDVQLWTGSDLSHLTPATSFETSFSVQY
jgi:hypothetical protein